MPTTNHKSRWHPGIVVHVDHSEDTKRQNICRLVPRPSHVQVTSLEDAAEISQIPDDCLDRPLVCCPFSLSVLVASSKVSYLLKPQQAWSFVEEPSPCSRYHSAVIVYLQARSSGWRFMWLQCTPLCYISYSSLRPVDLKIGYHFCFICPSTTSMLAAAFPRLYDSILILTA